MSDSYSHYWVKTMEKLEVKGLGLLSIQTNWKRNGASRRAERVCRMAGGYSGQCGVQKLKESSKKEGV